ncbi:MAG: hypothetical protein AABW72_02315 [archaeon]
MNGQISIEFIISFSIFLAAILLFVNITKGLEGLPEGLGKNAKISYCSAIANSGYATKSEIKTNESCSEKLREKTFFELNNGG